MTQKQILKLYELKGRLEARDTILDTDILFTQRLREALVTDNYNGRATGKIEACKEWQRENLLILEAVCQIIEELENARE